MWVSFICASTRRGAQRRLAESPCRQLPSSLNAESRCGQIAIAVSRVSLGSFAMLVSRMINSLDANNIPLETLQEASSRCSEQQFLEQNKVLTAPHVMT